MKSVIAALTLASVAYAQSSTSSAASSIPTGLSDSCRTFMTGLNNNQELSTCLNKLIEATSGFDSGSTTSTAVTGALTKVCGTDFTYCKTDTIRGTLADFWTNCSAELLAGRADVIDKYDFLYLIAPIKGAMCTKDGGEYCVTKLNNPASTPSASSSASSSATQAKRAEELWKRQTNTTDQLALGNDAATYNTQGLPYLFITTDSPANVLCSNCAQQIVTQYVAFESVTPHALGISNSPILSGQVKLWEKLKETCGTDFTGGIMNSASNQEQSNSLSGALEDAKVTGGVTMLAAIASALFGAVALF